MSCTHYQATYAGFLDWKNHNNGFRSKLMLPCGRQWSEHDACPIFQELADLYGGFDKMISKLYNYSINDPGNFDIAEKFFKEKINPYQLNGVHLWNK